MAGRPIGVAAGNIARRRNPTKLDADRELTMAVRENDIEEARMILNSDKYVLEPTSRSEYLQKVIIEGKYNILDLFLEDDRFTSDIVLKAACTIRNINALRALLEQYDFSPEEESKAFMQLVWKRIIKSIR